MAYHKRRAADMDSTSTTMIELHASSAHSPNTFHQSFAPDTPLLVVHHCIAVFFGCDAVTVSTTASTTPLSMFSKVCHLTASPHLVVQSLIYNERRRHYLQRFMDTHPEWYIYTQTHKHQKTTKEPTKDATKEPTSAT